MPGAAGSRAMRAAMAQALMAPVLMTQVPISGEYGSSAGFPGVPGDPTDRE